MNHDTQAELDVLRYHMYLQERMMVVVAVMVAFFTFMLWDTLYVDHSFPATLTATVFLPMTSALLLFIAFAYTEARLMAAEVEEVPQD